MTPPKSQARCGRCAHFIDNPHELERMLVGITILSSAWGDTRGDQGICDLHQCFLQPVMSCTSFVGRQPQDPGNC